MPRGRFRADLQWAFPHVIVADYLVAVFGTGLETVIVAVSPAFVGGFARIARGMVPTIKEEPYVTAARTVGVSDFRIMWRHILPNALPPDRSSAPVHQAQRRPR